MKRILWNRSGEIKMLAKKFDEPLSGCSEQESQFSLFFQLLSKKGKICIPSNRKMNDDIIIRQPGSILRGLLFLTISL
jgi:hypothetical protein